MTYNDRNTIMNEHLCKHEKDGIEPLSGNNPNLPDYVTIHECPTCGMWAEYDTELGSYRQTV